MKLRAQEAAGQFRCRKPARPCGTRSIPGRPSHKKPKGGFRFQLLPFRCASGVPESRPAALTHLAHRSAVSGCLKWGKLPEDGGLQWHNWAYLRSIIFALKFEACVTRARAIPLRRPDCCPEAAELASVFIAVQEEEIDHFVQSHTSAHAVIPSDGMPDF